MTPANIYVQNMGDLFFLGRQEYFIVIVTQSATKVTECLNKVCPEKCKRNHF